MPDGNWLSHVSRTLEIAVALREMGHEVAFASDGDYMKLPRELGFPVRSLKTLEAEHVMHCSRSGRANWYDDRLLAECVDAELGVFEDESPDLVLVDFRLSAKTSCEVAGVPLAVVLNASWTNYYAVRTRAPEHLKFTRILGRPLANLVAPWLKSAILTIDCGPHRRLHKRRGLRPLGNIWDVWRGDLNLIADTPQYGPTRELPDDFHYIGPIVWEPDIQVPDWLDDLDPNRPTIYFTMGSTGHGRFFRLAVELFGDTGYQGVMTTAGLAEFESLPSNFFAVDYAPGSKIMEKSDVVVCQGGNGTIYQAMAHGVPVVGIPTMHDQEFNLDRVVDLGLGIHLSELRLKPEHLRTAVEKALHEPSYRANARKQREVLMAYNGPQRGAEVIDDFLAGKIRTC